MKKSLSHLPEKKQEELESLAGRVKVLAALTKELCEAEIARYDSKTSN